MGVGFGATVGFMDSEGRWVPVKAGSTPLPVSGGSSGPTVTSVNGETGEVVLSASDVGARPAGNVPWGEVSGKPATFAPTIGTTANTALAGNTVIPEAATWDNLPDKPDTFPPAAHNQAATTVTVDAIPDLTGANVQLALADLAARVANLEAEIT